MTPEQRKAMREAVTDVRALVDSPSGLARRRLFDCRLSLVLLCEGTDALLAERDALEQERDRLAARHAEPAPADLVEVVRQAIEPLIVPALAPTEIDDVAVAAVEAMHAADRLLKPGHVAVPVEDLRTVLNFHQWAWQGADIRLRGQLEEAGYDPYQMAAPPRTPRRERMVERDYLDEIEVDDDDPWAWAEMECSRGHDGSCGQAGSEYCEFECPFRGRS